MNRFYTGLREVSGSQKINTPKLIAFDIKTALQKRNSEILDRFTKHFNNPLIIPQLVKHAAIRKVAQPPINQFLDDEHVNK